ncbi:MAG TPA: type II toxin-antitoxin system VapC family toxin [Caulobacteraceae bacterium]|nr:type II toxin-antitoxin system VapC family toxin [Caulobacteraceae bacterium]
MVIDSSAIVAILLKEPEAAAFALEIERAPIRLVSAATLLETSIALEARRGTEAARDLDLFVYRSGIQIVPFDEGQAGLARTAWRRFGRGNHPAGLNYGDCFAYALAESRGEPLLFKGGDFALTDVQAVV